MDAFIVYSLHWCFVFAALAFSWRRSRHYLHPHFLFTCMLVVFLSDFLIRGYDDRSLDYVSQGDVLVYQLIMLTILSIMVFSTAFVNVPRLENNVRHLAKFSETKFGPGVRQMIFLVAIAVLGATLIKRFSVVDWSLDEVIRQSLNPRGQRDWDQAQFSGNFVFAIISILLPYSAIAPAYLYATGRGPGRYVSLAMFIIVVTILVTDGSRTPVAISLASLALFWATQYKSLAIRGGILIIIMSIMIALFSLMYSFRSIGYHVSASATGSHFELTYHQDDSYYRAILAYQYSERTGKSWDPWFFWSTIAVNPIPRALWQSKPLMDGIFYDGFKLDYVTNSFLGETVAMTGVTLSIIFAPIIGFGLFLILFNALRLLVMPLGTATYLVIALYVYMCIRSLPNLTQFLYLPAFAVITALAFHRVERRAKLGQRLAR